MALRVCLILVIVGCAVEAAAPRTLLGKKLASVLDRVAHPHIPQPNELDSSIQQSGSSSSEERADGGCLRRQAKYGDVCVCNARYCDVAPTEPPGGLEEGHFIRIVSTEDGRRMDASMGDMIYRDRPETQVNKTNKPDDIVYDFLPFPPRQKIVGFGGAVTDSAAAHMLQLSEATRHQLLNAYFGADGSRYRLLRVPLGGSDFSTHEYSYDDNNGVPDPTLAKFALAPEDLKLKIPIIREAEKVAGQKLKLVTAPWGAPGWMVNKDSNGIKLKEEYKQTWADYYVKFLEEYEKQGLNFWAVSPQNEPDDGYGLNNNFNRLGWSPESMREWLANYFIPAVKKTKSDVKILIHDDQRSHLPDWPVRTLNDSAVLDAVDGIAVHWYTDNSTDPAALSQTHELVPDKFLLYTEACDGSSISGGEPVQLGSWARGVNYARDMIQVLNNWVVGWMDWNLALNPSGGPTWASNNLDAPIIVNAETDEFYKQPTYYALQHFSRYIVPGAWNAHLKPAAGSNPDANVSAAAFVTKDRFVIVWVNEDPVPRQVAVAIGGIPYYRDTLAPNSIQTTVAHPRPAGT